MTWQRSVGASECVTVAGVRPLHDTVAGRRHQRRGFGCRPAIHLATVVGMRPVWEEHPAFFRGLAEERIRLQRPRTYAVRARLIDAVVFGPERRALPDVSVIARRSSPALHASAPGRIAPQS